MSDTASETVSETVSETSSNITSDISSDTPKETLLDNYINQVTEEDQTVSFLSVPSQIHSEVSVIAFSSLNDRLIVDRETQEVLFYEAVDDLLVNLTDAEGLDELITALTMAKELLSND